MSLENYRKNICEIKKGVGLPNSEFFDMEFSPYSEEFIEAFNFYTETLNHHKDYGISPAYMYYNNFRSRNAKAGLLNNTYLITINMGTLHWLVDNFKYNDTIPTSGIRLIDIISKHIDTAPQNLMYQMCFHFTVYHEIAHLIQNSSYLESHLDEYPKTNDYNNRRHLLEIDADEFSSLCLGTHINQYAEKLFGASLNQDILEGIIIFCLVPIFLYLSSFAGSKEQMYFYERSHPHPIIRVMLVTMTICHYINQDLDANEKEFSINHKIVLNRTLQVASELEQSVFNSPYVEDFIDSLKINLQNILDYVSYFDELKNEDNTLAVAKWNQKISDESK